MLQKKWDAVLHGRAEIASAKAVIIAEEKSAAAAAQAHLAAEKALASAKAQSRAGEVELLEIETLLEKLQAKSYEALSKRELKAVETELATATAKKGSLEESILSLMDTIASGDISVAASAQALAEKQKAAAEKVAAMKERISRFEGIVAEHESAFKTGLNDLSVQTRSRFSKMVTSAEGKGIVPIEGENCGGCHFTIPFDIRREALQGNTLLGCPHCGKYMYAPDAFPSLGV